ncbi:MAG: hypothetical protein QOI59_745 [Gammaproteobacteria bacterium]|nr:hypothetical protein [Gammaproteobacteria bacterium]
MTVTARSVRTSSRADTNEPGQSVLSVLGNIARRRT